MSENTYNTYNLSNSSNAVNTAKDFLVRHPEAVVAGASIVVHTAVFFAGRKAGFKAGLSKGRVQGFNEGVMYALKHGAALMQNAEVQKAVLR